MLGNIIDTLHFRQAHDFIVPDQPSPASPPLVLDVLQQFRLIYGSMRQYFRLVEARCGVSGSAMWVLQEVQRQPGIGIGELARRLGIHQSTCSLLVDKLVARAYLGKTRQASDQRRVGLMLATAGETALAALPGPAEGLLPQALSALPEVALKTLNINLDALIRQLPARDEPSATTPLADLLDPDQER